MSPEHLSKKQYSKASYVLSFFLSFFLYHHSHSSSSSDVWSFGVTAFEVLARSRPYPDRDAISVVVDVVSKGLMPTFPESVPPALVTVLNQCFVFEVEKRAAIDSIQVQLRELLEAKE
jgi:serine/threonine protein kinase